MKRPALVGILNLTPDSFSGDGQGGEAALQHAKTLALAGADILDIGAESTRPGATPLTDEEEWARLEPVLIALRDQPWRAQLRLSVDTYHVSTAAFALATGVEIINDVSGLGQHAMLEMLSGHGCDCIVMHSLGLPADPAVTWPPSADALSEILRWKAGVIARAEQAGIAPERLIFDPGLGFGKTAEQSLALVLGARSLIASGGRWLFGHSRKSFLKLFTQAPAQERDALTQAFSLMLAEADVPYLRVHDVAGHHALFERLCT